LDRQTLCYEVLLIDILIEARTDAWHVSLEVFKARDNHANDVKILRWRSERDAADLRYARLEQQRYDPV
jgi:hypothetical protein